MHSSEMIENHRENLFSRYVSLMNNEAFVKSVEICEQPKVIHPKYSNHWLSTVAHAIDCVCSKILNHGLNHGLLFSLFKFFGWKNILN